MNRGEKVKPKYSVWQNSAYVIKDAWRRDPSVVGGILAQILLSVAVSTVALFLPKTVVSQITGGVPARMLVITVLAFTGATVVLQAVKNYLGTSTQVGRIFLRIRLSYDILDKVMETDYANLEDQHFTDVKQKAREQTNGNGASTEQIYGCFANLGTNLLGFGVYVALLASVSPLILLVTAATTLLGAAARQWANQWRHTHEHESSGYGKRIWYISFVGEKYEMAKDIRLFAMTNWLKDVRDVYLKLLFDFNRRAESKQFLADAVDCLGTLAREGFAYAYLIGLVLSFKLPVDQFVLLFAAIGGFSGWIMGILNEYAALSRHSLNFCYVREYLEYPDRFRRDDGESIAPEAGKAYALELRNVSFRYSGAEENTLENINLTIRPGEKLAVVGLNGAGKTTLVKLLCGFYDPTEGEVLLNGKDIRQYNRKQYYGLFAAVFQEFNIMPLTVAQNITQVWADYDRDKLSRCLKLSGLYEKVNALPEKTDSLMLKTVNEEAVAFSGGETQNLMLARALYRDAPILILDEPTAALDPIAESEMYNRYHELSGGKTSVYISHRLASTRFCDRIIFVGNKSIAESGTHDELLARGGRYAELFEIQSKYYNEGKEGRHD